VKADPRAPVREASEARSCVATLEVVERSLCSLALRTALRFEPGLLLPSETSLLPPSCPTTHEHLRAMLRQVLRYGRAKNVRNRGLLEDAAVQPRRVERAVPQERALRAMCRSS
jgi:hypothetical protein